MKLEVRPKHDKVDASEYGAVASRDFEIRLTNLGSAPITLVEPGDGSDGGRRTPIMKWSIELIGGTHEPPELTGCGNINVLRPDEVFELQPGEGRLLGEWVPDVWVTQEGRYRLRLRYENDPNLQWGGIPLGEHDAEAMRRVQNSTPCVAVSNDVSIEVTRVPKQ